MNKQSIRVRFAPSPTGQLHLGGARTALFNWLYAQHHGGEFFLRIEDTDRDRSKEVYTGQIIDSLNWLGMQWSKPLLFQSERTGAYKNAIQKLLDNGTAYRCFLTREELDQARKEAQGKGGDFHVPNTYRDIPLQDQKRLLNAGQSFTIRLKIPPGKTFFKDHIYGAITVDNE